MRRIRRKAGDRVRRRNRRNLVDHHIRRRGEVSAGTKSRHQADRRIRPIAQSRIATNRVQVHLRSRAGAGEIAADAESAA